MDGVAVLIKEKYDKDSIGQDIDTGLIRDEILVTQKSVSRSEWYTAGKNGFNASKVLETPIVNYDGQNLIEYEGKLYSIYRTFETEDDSIELYLEEKVGV